MKQAMWLLGVLCLQVCLLSTTAFSDQTDEQQPYKPTKPWTSAIQDLYTRRCQKKALNIVKDSSHPSHYLLSHGKRYRCSKSGTNRALNSFYPQAIRLLNTSLRTKRQTEAEGQCKNVCLSLIGEMSGLSGMPGPPTGWSLRIKRQKKFRSECKKNLEMCRSRLGALTPMSHPGGSWVKHHQTPTKEVISRIKSREKVRSQCQPVKAMNLSLPLRRGALLPCTSPLVFQDLKAGEAEESQEQEQARTYHKVGGVAIGLGSILKAAQ
ncbi:uncharacterized protein LOC135508122 isoform X1 [Oncorhynchus masou masou]|uniref:uncharacterized protein LOC135508122 isoform X1 n=1 Tax=Oncorhynchus masou masou TaxID=90313 RepID=UPI003182FF44